MATPKTIIAYDVSQKKLGIVRQGTTLSISRAYELVDDTGGSLDSVSGGVLREEMEWADIPASIQAALLAIDTWTYNQILVAEGMT
jgi:hypothetical protein